MYFIGITISGEKVVGCGCVQYQGRCYITVDDTISVCRNSDMHDRFTVCGEWYEVRPETVMCYDPDMEGLT